MGNCVVTTINKPTKAIEVLYEKFGSNLIVVGDEKTPENWNYKTVQYMLDLPKEKDYYCGYAPRNSYARKNLGYLQAIKSGAKVIYDTDDDNIPEDKWWYIRGVHTSAYEVYKKGWCNIYSHLSHDFIWVRGFSLKHLHDKIVLGSIVQIESSIQQGLANGEPDVDAIWRLLFNKPQFFNSVDSLHLSNGSWCPFNSQSTWWFPKAYVLMYLPVNCSFRMTDIWRSFIAQRCLWELGEGVTFHSPAEVYQERNPHDLLKDFADEIDGYLKNDLIVETLSKLKLQKGEENICDNLLSCYHALFEIGVFPLNEIRSVKAWIKDYESIKSNMG